MREARNSKTAPPGRAALALADRLARMAMTLAVLALLLHAGRWFASALAPVPAPLKIEVEEGDLRYVFPDADSFSALSQVEGVPFYWAFRKLGGPGSEGVSRIGACFLTTGLDSGIMGYGGQVQVLVGLSSEGRIQGIRVMPGRNRESRGYVDALYEQEFDSRYRGKDFRDPFLAGEDVDGITGATVSVEAVNASVRNAARLVAQRVLGLEHPARGAAGVPSLSSFIGPAAALILVIAGFAGASARAGMAFRTVLLVFAAAAAFAIGGSHLTVADSLRALSADPLPGRAFYPWAAVIATVSAATLLAGKGWCAWACPFGAVQEIVFRVTPWRLKVSRMADRRLRRARWITLSVAAFIFASGAGAGALAFEPLASSFRLRALTVSSGALLLAVVLASTLIERFWCKYLCPVSALVGLFFGNRLLFRKNAQACGGCLRGEKACRYEREYGPEFAGRGENMHGDCIC